MTEKKIDQTTQEQSIQEPQEPKIETRLLEVSRISHMKAGGRRFRFRAVVVAGDKKGKVGVASAKGQDVPDAIQKAVKQALKRMIEIPIFEGTIPHEVEAKFKTAKVLLKPQRKGKGLVAGGTVRVVCELAGLQDISSKVISNTKNKLNLARATLLALSRLKTKKQTEDGSTT